jgi:hypothetical protein
MENWYKELLMNESGLSDITLLDASGFTHWRKRFKKGRNISQS